MKKKFKPLQRNLHGSPGRIGEKSFIWKCLEAKLGMRMNDTSGGKTQLF